MSIPSMETDNRSSTIIDDNLSVMSHDLSETTVSIQTSLSSWHSVLSDINLNSNLFTRSYSINTWLKICFIEPDIRLTTAQEWKLRTCMRRFISLCNLPLRISCMKINESISVINQKQHSLSTTESSLNTSENDSCLDQGQILNDQLHQLGLYLHILSIIDANNRILEAKLFGYDPKNFENKKMIPIPIIKPPKFIFHIASNILKLNLRSSSSLLELQFLTRNNESIRGYYYK